MLSLFNDPFSSSFFNDPFFTPGFGTMPMNRGRGTQGQLTSGDQRLGQPRQGQGSLWDFNQLLSTPLTPSLREEEKQFVLEVSRPQGINKEDLKIDVNEGVLTISGEHKEEKSDDPNRKSSSFTSFYRQMTLPNTVDESKISAQLTPEGKLMLTMPKLEGMDKKRRINIS